MRLPKKTAGLIQMTNAEMRETNGGLIWLVVPAVLLLAGCTTTGTTPDRTREAVDSYPGPPPSR